MGKKIIKHRGAHTLEGRKVTVEGKKFYIAAVFMDGSILLEPEAVYGLEGSVKKGRKPN